jgi:hypothetical protein
MGYKRESHPDSGYAGMCIQKKTLPDGSTIHFVPPPPIDPPRWRRGVSDRLMDWFEAWNAPFEIKGILFIGNIWWFWAVVLFDEAVDWVIRLRGRHEPVSTDDQQLRLGHAEGPGVADPPYVHDPDRAASGARPAATVPVRPDLQEEGP